MEGAGLAPGNEQTRRALTDATRCPSTARAPFPEDFLFHRPEVPLILNHVQMLRNLSGAAGGLSGMTAEHLRPLESSRDSEMFWSMCQEFARGIIPVPVLEAIRMGRMTALQKPSGGVRGIVVGDIIRRLVSRTLAQQLAPAVALWLQTLPTTVDLKWSQMVSRCSTEHNWPSTQRWCLLSGGMGCHTPSA